ncbi:hypothetical protein [Paenibacillus donghaensis]|uniref:Uncharacterized protein n=1 Tax=Paenibacillus donghaensis TaxID=414771 RepID=A0A2Z2K4V3_9BACL|nr:hypothetical protein [Paenibacillus donghaensis]ASA19434.1 hypothetical protein B9T62_00335 [Paenibacillus donghaensis]
MVKDPNEQERAQMKRKLDEELGPVRFTGQDRVLRQTHPRSLGSRLHALWNKELEIPLRPVGALGAVLLVAAFALNPLRSSETPQPAQQPVQQSAHRELIEAGGSTYWKDVYEQAVMKDAN